MSLADACSRIELILSDVDGVLTDGGIQLIDDGRQMVTFHIRDGMAARLWREAGKKFGIVTGRDLEAVRRRTADLRLEVARFGVDDKLPAVDAIAAEMELSREQICFIGDDLPDLAPMKFVGMGVAVADASLDVRQAADYVTTAAGGNGAVREVIELVLRAQQRWDDALNPYQAT